MKTRSILLLCASIALLVLLAACGTANPLQGTPLAQTNTVYGFWNGLWDGITAIIAFICNVFGGHFGIYQVHNNGNWYDFGFLIGVGAFAGACGATGSAASSKR